MYFIYVPVSVHNTYTQYWQYSSNNSDKFNYSWGNELNGKIIICLCILVILDEWWLFVVNYTSFIITIFLLHSHELLFYLHWLTLFLCLRKFDMRRLFIIFVIICMKVSTKINKKKSLSNVCLLWKYRNWLIFVIRWCEERWMSRH